MILNSIKSECRPSARPLAVQFVLILQKAVPRLALWSRLAMAIERLHGVFRGELAFAQQALNQQPIDFAHELHEFVRVLPLWPGVSRLA